MKHQTSLAACLALLLIPLAACDDEGSSGAAVSTNANPPSLELSACAAELPRAKATSLLGTTVTDSGHAVYAGYRRCQWLGSGAAISWSWTPEPTLAGMLKTFSSNQKRTLGGDSGTCSVELPGTDLEAEFVWSTRSVNGMSMTRVETSQGCKPDGFEQQLWSTCRSRSLEVSVDKPGASNAVLWAVAESTVVRACNAR